MVELVEDKIVALQKLRVEGVQLQQVGPVVRGVAVGDGHQELDAGQSSDVDLRLFALVDKLKSDLVLGKLRHCADPHQELDVQVLYLSSAELALEERVGVCLVEVDDFDLVLIENLEQRLDFLFCHLVVVGGLLRVHGVGGFEVERGIGLHFKN